MVKLCLKFGANIEWRDDFGITALGYAAENGNCQVEKIVDVKNINGFSPLELALSNCYVQDSLIFQLISFTNVLQLSNQNSKTGKTPLHIASENNRQMAIDLLLESGIDTSIKDNEGRIAVHYAVISDNLPMETVCKLCQYTLNLNISDAYGLSPIDYAVISSKAPIMLLLINYGCKITTKTWELVKTKIELLALLLDKLMKDCRYFLSVK
ncbi:26S proteasome non-ATPase regulatory subunit 10-like [Octopus sinensis]|uniref:26S proteasome non-ATPase regulatory subunit 10-like n=1 Tax=Octopus sinensis TaxID=2607531 RepID=A0A6P7TS48_9MOLL|nr:26S proteasome non-ATPase regulatory subunit 10-like [Octopus sinensis]